MKEQLQEQAREIWASVMANGSQEARNNKKLDQEDMNKMSLESVIRVMFGSCTVGRGGEPDRSISPQEDDGPGTPNSPARSRGDTLYRQLFSDNHLMAEEAVHHLRQQLEQRKTSSPSRQFRGREVPGLFPASTPKHNLQIQIPNLPKELPNTVDPLSPNQPLHAMSFDDGISVITQLTLEELTNLVDGYDMDRIHSDITQDPIEEVEESWKQTINPFMASTPSPGRRKSKSSPLSIIRSGQSQATMQTKRSVGNKSLATKSTLSTQTNEFANMLQREEQKYWEEVVKEENGTTGTTTSHISRQKKITKARELSRRMRRVSEQIPEEQVLKPDETITTVHSTVYSGKSSSQDTPLTATQLDPDRFLNVLIMPPGTEMGEI